MRAITLHLMEWSPLTDPSKPRNWVHKVSVTTCPSCLADVILDGLRSVLLDR